MARRTTKPQTDTAQAKPAAKPATTHRAASGTKPAQAETVVESAPDLVGVSYLGPVRRAALAAADVKTRADLARASVDQLVGMTGMGRGLAQRVLDSLHAAEKSAPASALTAPPAPNEVMPAAKAELDAPPAPSEAGTAAPAFETAPETETQTVAEPGDEPTDTTASEFDRALFAARTALSDVTRTFAASEKLRKPFVRLAKRLDTAGTKNDANTLGAGRTARIHKRLVILTDRLEAAAKKANGKSVPLTPKREDRLRERVQNESRALAKLMQSQPPKPAQSSTSANGSSAKRNTAAKPTKKPQK